MSYRKPKIPLRWGSVYFRQLASSLAAGLPMTTALNVLENKGLHHSVAKLNNELSEAVISGETIYPVVKKWSSALTHAAPALISMGETTGEFDFAFASIADIYDSSWRTRKRLMTALSYPILLLCLGLLIIPIPVLFLEGIAAYFRGLLVPLTMLLVAFALTIGFKYFKRTNKYFDEVSSRFVLGIPIIGKTIRKIELARFAGVLATVFNAGLDLHQSMEISISSFTNRFMRNRIYDTIFGQLERGDTLAGAMAKSGEFTPVFINMVATGEKTGNLEEMLSRCEQMFSEEADSSITRLTILTGPVVFILIAIYFAYVIINFWTGYFRTLEGLIRLS